MMKSLMPLNRRPLGLRLIIAYKLLKAPLMLALALWLCVAPSAAIHLAKLVTSELSEVSATLGHLAHGISRYLTRHWATQIAILAWMDGLSTALEGILLWRGSAWGEWIVVVGLALLMPFELSRVVRHPSLLRVLVLTINAALFAYLIHARLARRGNGSPEQVP